MWPVVYKSRGSQNPGERALHTGLDLWPTHLPLRFSVLERILALGAGMLLSDHRFHSFFLQSQILQGLQKAGSFCTCPWFLDLF